MYAAGTEETENNPRGKIELRRPYRYNRESKTSSKEKKRMNELVFESRHEN